MRTGIVRSKAQPEAVAEHRHRVAFVAVVGGVVAECASMVAVDSGRMMRRRM